jgi:hypothetical protein
MLRLSTLAIATVLVACSSSSSSDSTSNTDAGPDSGTESAVDAGGDGAKTREPKIHRPTAVDCPTDRAVGTAGSPRTGDKCESDAECTAGKNGRCESSLQGNVCSYDECFTDADCGSAGVCGCRQDQLYGANVCYKGNCRTDADCPTSWCSPSAVNVSTSCTTGIPVGVVGFFCHTAADECTDDSDCPSATGTCTFDVDKLHWACRALLCFGG